MESGLIKVLNLSNNHIDDNGINYLVVLLKSKRTLTDLYLNDNQIGDRGVELLAKALSHPTATLQKLYLSNNTRITDRSINHLIGMFKTNQSLNSLWLLKCGFSDDGRGRLLEAVESKRGLYLNLERY
jgi:Ran GTPase-activating protein (RanGAP) involved in mRNA processing and transport